jgi:hypothetical protein
MKAIILNNIEQFEQLENSIHEALKVINKYPENTEKYAEPIYSIDHSKIAIPIETEGIRGEIITGIIQGFEVVEILATDEFWFEQIKMEMI